MPTPKRGPRFGGSSSHQQHLLANLASDLYRHGRITTTEAKAKALRPYAEKLITRAKRGDLAARRQVLSKLHDRDVVAYLFEDVAPRFAERDGGYTRILKLAPRKGDNASMALIELVDRGGSSGEEVIEESKAGRSRGLFGRRRRRGQQAESAGFDVGALGADDDEEAEDTGFDVEDDAQVAAAIAEATGGGADASDASPDSPASADSDDSPGSPDSVDSPDSADSPEDGDEDDGDGADDQTTT